MTDGDLTPQYAAELILREYERARFKFPAMNSSHEGYAVILEELDEMWAEVKANRPAFAKKEALQVAAMALAFMVEVKG